jgi:hypothetical protein
MCYIVCVKLWVLLAVIEYAIQVPLSVRRIPHQSGWTEAIRGEQTISGVMRLANHSCSF